MITNAVRVAVLAALRPALRLTAPLVVALATHGVAQAGLVSGRWDPAFGPTLPNLSWQARAEFTVPDACTNQADGVYVTSGLCAGVTVNHAWLRLFDATAGADPNDFFGFNANSSVVDFQTDPVSPGYAAHKVRIQNQQVVGIEAGRADIPPLLLTPVLMSTFVGAAANNIFGMVFTVAGPSVFCFACDPVNGYPAGHNAGNPDVYAATAALEQYLVTYDDLGAPKLTDSNGNALGARLDGAGNLLGFTTLDGRLPEPGTWALALLALAGFGVTRRR